MTRDLTQVLAAEQVKLLERAEAGDLPCPWCDQPLSGEFVCFPVEGDEFYVGVKLSCSCGFVEY